MFSLGALCTYGGASGEFGGSDHPHLNMLVQAISLSFWAAGAFFFLGPMRVSTSCIELMNAANHIRAALPLDQHREAESLMTYLEKQNTLNGPGYMLGGAMITPRLFYSAMITGGSVLAGAFLSSV